MEKFKCEWKVKGTSLGNCRSHFSFLLPLMGKIDSRKIISIAHNRLYFKLYLRMIFDTVLIKKLLNISFYL